MKKPKTPSSQDAGKSRGQSDHEWFWRKLDDYLRDRNLKQSHPRTVVIRQFLQMDRHIDAEALHKSLKKSGDNIGLATVYRTLQLLKEAGLVDQKAFADGRSVYELLDPTGHHDHIVCLTCGAVIEFENDEIENLQRQVAKTHHFELARHRLDLFGHCQIKDCQRKTTGRAFGKESVY